MGKEQERADSSEIKFSIDLDENKVPVNIQWSATDNNDGKPAACKAFMTSLWESEANNTLRIDLWTKDMPIDEMKVFFHQSLLSMADTFERATGEKAVTGDLRDYCAHFAEKMNILKDN
ncbi:MAG TPA: gliding motility protein GldC [Flavobacteriales bacterium]|jgi:gliding motility-associated protein GldC|nr:gliding motility protein GldC [Flavobacteriales bacterium]HIA12815.1 gliding motility protein GldC [Flavobacteriales bacterium]HIO71477.1 gliding motility protein GldC [Flavobacteriales bacterium]